MEQVSGGATQSQDLLSAAASILGREVHVFLRPSAIPLDEGSSAGPQGDDEPDEFYEFTASDFSQVLKYKKQDNFLKTKKIRDEEEAARQARITKACIRVQFPDNLILESMFQPSDPVSLLVELIQKVIQNPEVPFYLYTTPPKQRIKNLEQSMYSAGLAPGALVYFSYELLKGQDGFPGAPYLRSEIAALKDLHLVGSLVSVPEPPASQGIDLTSNSMDSESLSDKQEVKRSGGKPKWFKQR